jgi:hypothetical protein
MGTRLPQYIRIAASVHTDINMFIYSQPTLEGGDGAPFTWQSALSCSSCLIFWLPRLQCLRHQISLLTAGELLVHAHCYLHRPNLIPFGHRRPYAPHYFLKLKSADALVMVSAHYICQLTQLKTVWTTQCCSFVLVSSNAKLYSYNRIREGSHVYTFQSSTFSQSLQALDDYVVGAAVGESGPCAVTAQALNEETHEQAMFMVDAGSLMRYRDSGKQMLFAPDR